MFLRSSIKQLSDNVFSFNRRDKIILFNRKSFGTIYLDSAQDFLPSLNHIVKQMEGQTPNVVFKTPLLRKIRIEVTLSCNCACDYCLVYKNKLSEVNTSMGLKTAREIISFYKKNIKKGSCMIIGGEPFLNWKVVKFLINHIKDPIKIFTNGTIINEDILRVLKDNKHVRLLISLDGKETDNKQRKFKNGENIYQKVIKNIKTLQENNCSLGIVCLASGDNVGRLSEVVKFFSEDLKVKYIGVSFPHFVRDKKFNFDMEKYTEEMIKLFDFAIEKKIYIDQLAKRFSPLINKKFRFYGCKIAGEQKTFYPSGRETFCTKIDSLENSSKYNLKYFQENIPVNNDFCKGCPAIGVCGGGCFWDGIMRYKNSVDERECILNNTLLDHFLWSIYSAEKKGIPLKEKFRSLILD